MSFVDAGIEERDRDAPSVEARQLGVGRCPLDGPNSSDASSCSEIEAGNAARTGEHPCHLGDLVEQRDRARIERGREAVDHPCVAVVGSHDHAERASLGSTSCCAANAWVVHERSCASVA